MSSPKRFKFPGMTSTKPSKTPSKESLIVRFYDANIQAKDAHGRTQEDMLAWSEAKLEQCHNYIQMLFPVPEGSAFNWEAPIIDREVMDTFRSRQDLQDRLRLSFERMLHFYGFQVATEENDNEKTKEDTNEDAKIDDSSKKVVANVAEESPSAETSTTTSTKSKVKQKDEETEPNGNTADNDVSKPTSSSNTSSAQSGYTIIRAPHWRTSFRNWAVRFDHNHLRITRILRCLRILGLQVECDAFFKALKDVFDDPAFSISDRTMTYWKRAVIRPLYIAPDDERIEWLMAWEKGQEQQEDEKAGKGKEKQGL